jgi:hypothetical protein
MKFQPSRSSVSTKLEVGAIAAHSSRVFLQRHVDQFRTLKLTLAAMLCSAWLAPASARCIEQDVPLNEVSLIVLNAAAGALNGFSADEATQIGVGAEAVFELEGHAGGSQYEILIAPDGSVLEVEKDDE